MIRRASVVLATLLVAFVPLTASAQVAGSQDSVVRAALARIAPGKQIRLHTVAQGRLEGSFAGVTDTGLTLGVVSPASVALTAIDSLWIRGSASKTGAIVGGAFGVVAGAVVGAIAAGLDETGNTSQAAAAVGLGFAGGAGCALVGGMIGTAIPKWHRRVP